MAKGAVGIHAPGLDWIGRRFRAAVGLVLMRMMTEVTCCIAFLVLTVHARRRPRELQRHEYQ